MKELSLNIGGMSCQHCVNRIRKSIESLRYIIDLHVEIGHIQLKYDEEKLSKLTIENTIREAGYTILE